MKVLVEVNRRDFLHPKGRCQKESLLIKSSASEIASINKPREINHESQSDLKNLRRR
jgi:hypothetical protein